MKKILLIVIILFLFCLGLVIYFIMQVYKIEHGLAQSKHEEIIALELQNAPEKFLIENISKKIDPEFNIFCLVNSYNTPKEILTNYIKVDYDLYLQNNYYLSENFWGLVLYSTSKKQGLVYNIHRSKINYAGEKSICKDIKNAEIKKNDNAIDIEE